MDSKHYHPISYTYVNTKKIASRKLTFYTMAPKSLYSFDF